jgi:hypothetical protein
MKLIPRVAVVLAGVAMASVMSEGSTAAAVASPRVVAPGCVLTTGNVSYSANMLYVGSWLSGDCHGQVSVDLQLSSSASGPFTTVESSMTYPTGPDAQGGTAWFTDSYQAYGCEFYYRAVGTYGALSAVSPSPRHPC